MTVDVEEQPGPSCLADTSDDDDQLLALAHSRILLYLALIASPPNALRVLPVGFGVAERGSRRNGVGTVTLLEEDPSTADERAVAREESRYHRRPGHDRLDMLTARVPGTDLIIGMSRRLFGACAALTQVVAEVAHEVDAERPRPRLDAQYDEIVSINQERRELLHHLELERKTAARRTTRQGFEQGARGTWNQLINSPITFTTDPQPGFLEAATHDTYLAVDATVVTPEMV